MGRTINFSKSNLLPLIGVLREGAESDEFVLGMETDAPVGGAYYHIKEEEPVNEAYSNRGPIDLSAVGSVEYTWDFDDDEYREWLEDSEMQDSSESRMEYVKDYVEFELDFQDNETFHTFDTRYLSYSELEDMLGEKGASRILSDCMEDGSGRLETYELYADEEIDVNNPEELNAMAVRLLQHGEYYKGCRGFVLTNGEVVYTPSEHNHCSIINGVKGTFHFIRLGNIRVLDKSFDLSKPPTPEQRSVLRKMISSYSGDEIYMDIMDGNGEVGARYVRPRYDYIMMEIDRYFSEGRKPNGMMYEGREVNENLEVDVNASDVDLSSFRKKDSLQPSVWKDEDTLDSRVRLRLLDIADDFWEFVNLTWVEPLKIILTGSICNYNWSEYSDIDLHIVADFREVDEKTEFVREYLDSKKNEWNEKHGALRIMGYNVELYVQDISEDTESGGIYDLEENKWIRKPDPSDIKGIGLNKFPIKERAARIMTIIDDMYDVLSATDDLHVIEGIGEDSEHLWRKIKEMRKASLDKHGESGSGNICYKCLRRAGYLDKLWKLRTITYDKVNSIDEDRKVRPALGKSVVSYIRHLKESTDLNNTEIWYRGFDSDLGEKRDHMLWLTEEKEYAKEYGNAVMEYRIDGSRLKPISLYSLCDLFGFDGWHPYDGLDEEEASELLSSGYNCYMFDAGEYDDHCMCLLDESPIISRKMVAKGSVNEETVADGSSEGNPFKERWKAEREALKNYICNFGTLMQSKEDNKDGKVYKCLWDKYISGLIGYNYCLCVQWDQFAMKPKSSVVYIRALDKFTRNIRQLSFDDRGLDNTRGTFDDLRYYGRG